MKHPFGRLAGFLPSPETFCEACARKITWPIQAHKCAVCHKVLCGDHVVTLLRQSGRKWISIPGRVCNYRGDGGTCRDKHRANAAQEEMQ